MQFNPKYYLRNIPIFPFVEGQRRRFYKRAGQQQLMVNPSMGTDRRPSASSQRYLLLSTQQRSGSREKLNLLEAVATVEQSMDQPIGWRRKRSQVKKDEKNDEFIPTNVISNYDTVRK